MTQTQTQSPVKTVAKTWTDLSPRKSSVPEGLWLRCPGCEAMIYRKQMEANLHCCPECSHHYRIGAHERVRQVMGEALMKKWRASQRRAPKRSG